MLVYDNTGTKVDGYVITAFFRSLDTNESCKIMKLTPPKKSCEKIWTITSSITPRHDYNNFTTCLAVKQSVILLITSETVTTIGMDLQQKKQEGLKEIHRDIKGVHHSTLTSNADILLACKMDEKFEVALKSVSQNLYEGRGSQYHSWLVKGTWNEKGMKIECNVHSDSIVLAHELILTFCEVSETCQLVSVEDQNLEL